MITTHAKPLSALASTLLDIHVRGVYEFEVPGEPATGGVGILLRPARAQEILSPLPKPARDDLGTVHGDLGTAHDSAEDIQSQTLSDCAESSIAVLTDIDASCASQMSDSESDLSSANEDTHPTTGSSISKSATGGALPATGGYIIKPGMFDTDTTKQMATTKCSRATWGPNAHHNHRCSTMVISGWRTASISPRYV